MGYELPQPGRWCTQCGARQGIAGPAWICRVCVAGGPHKRIVRKNPNRRPLPPGTPLARLRYRAAGLCVTCGGDRDRTKPADLRPLPAPLGGRAVTGSPGAP